MSTPPLTRSRKPKADATPEPPHQDERPPSSDRLPPHSMESERGVLACLMLAPDEVAPKCSELFKSGGSVFFDLKHRTLYELMMDMWDRNQPIDLITLVESLRSNGTLEGVGGLPYVAALPDAVPSAANFEHYAEAVNKKYMLRRVLAACSEVTLMALNEAEPINNVLASASSKMQMVSELSSSDDATGLMKVLVPEAMEYIETLRKHAGQVTGVATGLADLDQMTWGLQPGEMIVLAARPSVGKTSLAMNIAEHVSVEGDTPVGVFSMEMTKASLMVRMLCSRARVGTVNVRKGWVTHNDENRLVKAAMEMMKAKLFIDDTSALAIGQLRAKARKMHKQHGIRLIVVDYLQLMNAQLRRSDNRQQEVSNISGGLKALAKELNVPVLVLSQLSRKMDDRGVNAAPKLSDLRESGSIEQDADVVTLLYRPFKEVINQDGTYQDCIPVTAIVAKNRNGPTGEVNLMFVKSCTRFENAAKVSAEDEQETEHNLL